MHSGEKPKKINLSINFLLLSTVILKYIFFQFSDPLPIPMILRICPHFRLIYRYRPNPRMTFQQLGGYSISFIPARAHIS